MSTSTPRFNEFQASVLDALRRWGATHGHDVREGRTYAYPDGDSRGLDISGVPLEVAPDQVWIASAYNGRVFERTEYRDTDALIDDLLKVMEEFTDDPVRMRHPAVRLWTRIFGV